MIRPPASAIADLRQGDDRREPQFPGDDLVGDGDYVLPMLASIPAEMRQSVVDRHAHLHGDYARGLVYLVRQEEENIVEVGCNAHLFPQAIVGHWTNPTPGSRAYRLRPTVRAEHGESTIVIVF